MEQFQRKLGQLLLQGRDFRFQAGKLLDEICLFRKRGGQGIGRLNWQSLAFLSRLSWPLRQIAWRGRRYWGGASCGRRGKRASMQRCQLLDLLLRQAFEACIRGVSGELHVGVSEPVS